MKVMRTKRERKTKIETKSFGVRKRKREEMCFIKFILVCQSINYNDKDKKIAFAAKQIILKIGYT